MAAEPVPRRELYTIGQIYHLLEAYGSILDRRHYDETDARLPRAKGPRRFDDGLPLGIDDKVTIDSAIAWLSQLHVDPQAADAIVGHYLEREPIARVAAWQGCSEFEVHALIRRGVRAMTQHANGERR